MWEYINIDDAWMNLIGTLLAKEPIDSRLGPCKELTAYQVKLSNVNQTFLLNPRRKLSPYYACAETLWYLQPTKSIRMIKAYAPQYEKFANDGQAYGAYGWRFFGPFDQFKLIIEDLRKNPLTRQAVVTAWETDDLRRPATIKDKPCTLSLQFLNRNSRLNLIATMRSNDAWLGFPYDVFAFTCLQRLVAHAVGLPPGWYVHQAGSEHLYEKNWRAAEEAIADTLDLYGERYVNWRRLEHEWAENSWPEDAWKRCVAEAVELEKFARTAGEHASAFVSQLPDRTFLLDATRVVGDKWGWPTRKNIHSPILKEALKCSS